MSTLIRRVGSLFRKSGQSRKTRRSILGAEPLECRRMLAATTLGVVEGTVFIDLNSSGSFDAGEEISGASIELYADDGDGIFDAGDTLADSTTTDINGDYQFTMLMTGTYFVQQPAQTVGTASLELMTSGPINVVGTGVAGVSVDSFVTASGPTTDTFPSGTPVEEVHNAGEAIGGQRDFRASLTSGGMGDTVSLRTNGGSLLVNPDFNAVGTYVVEWDGVDVAGTGLAPTGLGGVDLTVVGGTSGVGAGLELTSVQFDQPGGIVTVRVYTDAANYSESVINSIMPLTSENFYIPFQGVTDGLGFTTDVGAGADFTNVGAIELVVEATQQAMDGQITMIGVLGNDIQRSDFANPAPMPGIDIEKFTNGFQADEATDADVPSVTPGSTVTWQYVVTNTGDTNLNNLVVNDDQIGVVTNVVSRTGGDNDLLFEPGETWTFEATGTATEGLYKNLATATANDDAGTVVSDEDCSHYQGISASIDIEKLTNGFQADLPTDSDVPFLDVGASVTWTYVVTNTSTLNLTGVVVTDSDIGAVTNIISQSINNDNVLDPGEVWTYQASGTAIAGAYENQGTASATAAATGQNVSDSDQSHYVGSLPAIDLEKATNGQDADTPETGPTVFVGSLVTFTYTVTNAGNVPLSDVQVQDDNGTPTVATDDFFANFISGDSNNDSLLDLTETWIFRATRTATLGPYENTAVATALGPDTVDTGAASARMVVSDADPSNHTGVEAPAFISKRSYLASAYRG